MSIAKARRLWGRPAVAAALAHPAPTLPRETLDALCCFDDEPTAGGADLARWALALPAATFAGVVRLVAGVTCRDLVDAFATADRERMH
jgi:hypothetical protein